MPDKFVVWLKAQDAIEISAALGVSYQNVSAWKSRSSVPRPKMAAKIIKKSNGQIDWADIYAPFANKKASR